MYSIMIFIHEKIPMLHKIKTRTPLLAFILFVFAIGYTVAANKVVVIPLGGDSMPSGMVSTFNSTTCPTGWTKYTKAQGRFVVGLNDGGNIGLMNGLAQENAEFRFHSHRWSGFDAINYVWFTYNSNGNPTTIIEWTDGIGPEGSGFYPLARSSVTTTHWTDRSATTPPYVQLLYCEKV